jgi:hypothetical protein
MTFGGIAIQWPGYLHRMMSKIGAERSAGLHGVSNLVNRLR